MQSGYKVFVSASAYRFSTNVFNCNSWSNTGNSKVRLSGFEIGVVGDMERTSCLVAGVLEILVCAVRFCLVLLGNALNSAEKRFRVVQKQA